MALRPVVSPTPPVSAPVAAAAFCDARDVALYDHDNGDGPQEDGNGDGDGDGAGRARAGRGGGGAAAAEAKAAGGSPVHAVDYSYWIIQMPPSW